MLDIFSLIWWLLEFIVLKLLIYTILFLSFLIRVKEKCLQRFIYLQKWTFLHIIFLVHFYRFSSTNCIVWWWLSSCYFWNRTSINFVTYSFELCVFFNINRARIRRRFHTLLFVQKCSRRCFLDLDFNNLLFFILVWLKEYSWVSKNMCWLFHFFKSLSWLVSFSFSSWRVYIFINIWNVVRLMNHWLFEFCKYFLILLLKRGFYLSNWIIFFESRIELFLLVFINNWLNKSFVF